MKTFFLLVLIALLGTFIYLKVQVLGDPNSHFNQTTRFSLAKHPVLRTILGLHSVGDNRVDYMEGTSPIAIVWFSPEDTMVDSSILQKFADKVAQVTGRQVQLVSGGNLDDGTIQVSNLKSFTLKAASEDPAGTLGLNVFLTDDYSPRPDNELSSTYQDSGMIISLNAHRDFLKSYPEDVNQYLLASMLHEFGNQIGMLETAVGAPDCIMNLHAGIQGQPVEAFNGTEPQDFCSAEKLEINNIKLQLQNY